MQGIGCVAVAMPEALARLGSSDRFWTLREASGEREKRERERERERKREREREIE